MKSEETYSLGYSPAVIDRHSLRRASTCCSYFLPHLTPTSRVLDLGCGPGSITTDIASLIPSGTITGLDAGSSVIEIANAKAKELGLKNCDFQVGDVMKLPFEDETFDVVYTHQLLIHLPDPVEAMREMRRVCKVGGLVACRESDMGDAVFYPSTPGLKRSVEIMEKMIIEKGSVPHAGKFLVKWARDAGFEEGKVVESYSYLMQPSWKNSLMTGDVGENAVRLAVVGSEEEIKDMIAEWDTWEKTEGCWWKTGCGEVVCWKT
ncbi:b4a5a2cd-2949-4b91-a90b-1583e073e3e2 [Sclerotinia trifoliorum]|uniref:B4a5a2cd-2949-4b91-a90b-1583e073e3e2 n=1 Tax=Sclerotinia trifoliorum TaxID=28548 RepID=A0A8H2VN12_9HELO|nr:b4a5a2cd-2949-4b91-a90b-1583e073e3e2 [Sclerotinia trifoliorum]